MFSNPTGFRVVDKRLNFCFVKHGCLEGNWQILQNDVQFCNLKNFCLPEWMSWSKQCIYLQTPSKLKRSKEMTTYMFFKVKI